MTRNVFLVTLILSVIIATLISLAPNENWGSIYEEIAARSGMLLDNTLKLLAILGLIKYLFLDQNFAKNH
ncbi:MAG: hypothetical protein VYC40_02455 [Pseudomonadota bacterium]|nr:hypothetical protein [Pseudomonadota bacterium]|tara:strand:- start:263 stop:472 length:210 start_codon:yes stop_codon:yes gene_type:complete